MELKKLYTAVGRLEKTSDTYGQSCPSVQLGRQSYTLDIQEMIVWTSLNWRIAKWENIVLKCEKLASSMCFSTIKSWDDCIKRLIIRGLVVCGCGETEFDALYDLLGSLGIVPADGSVLIKCISFFKLVIFRKIPIKQAMKLFRKDKRTDYEARIMQLANQALLSTAEIIKCVEQDVFSISNQQYLMEKVYGDDTTTSYNIVSQMKNSRSSQAVTLAIANLYLRQQIIFERVHI